SLAWYSWIFIERPREASRAAQAPGVQPFLLYGRAAGMAGRRRRRPPHRLPGRMGPPRRESFPGFAPRRPSRHFRAAAILPGTGAPRRRGGKLGRFPITADDFAAHRAD